MPSPITPTIGRVVWYTPSEADLNFSPMVQLDPEQKLEARVAFVHGDGTVTLAITDHVARPHSHINVPLLGPDDQKPEAGGYAEWMPYQLAQAAAGTSANVAVPQSATPAA